MKGWKIDGVDAYTAVGDTASSVLKKLLKAAKDDGVTDENTTQLTLHIG
jgi:hypothetical protein